MKAIIIAGFAVGAAEFVILWLCHAAGVLHSDLGTRLLMLTLFTHVVGLIAVMVLLRRREQDVGFARLFGAGMMVSFAAGLTAGLGMLVFQRYVDPQYLDWIVESTRATVAEWPEEQRKQALAQLAETTPQVYALRDAMGYLIRGLLMTLLLSALLRLRVLRAAGTDPTAASEAGS